MPRRAGMGVAYKAFDTLMRRAVALNTFDDVAGSASADLFYREYGVLASLIHPNVVEILDVGEFDEDGVLKPYFVMPLLSGYTLYDLIYPAGMPLPAERCVGIITQACRALQAAHQRGLLHRDINPRSIFVMRDDAVKLVDFSVMHFSRDGSNYVAPEVISLKPPTARSDIFSLAAVCYEALTGMHPFDRGNESETATAILEHTPALASALNPLVNRPLAQAVAQAMAKDPQDRFESAAAFADALQAGLRNEQSAPVQSANLPNTVARAQRSFVVGDYDAAQKILAQLETAGINGVEVRSLRLELDKALRRRQSELQRDRELQTLSQQLAEAVDRAQAYEASGSYDYAIEEWLSVGDLQPAYPGLRDRLVRLRGLWKTAREHAKAELSAAVTEALQQGDHQQAGQLLQAARADFLGDSDYDRLLTIFETTAATPEVDHANAQDAAVADKRPPDEKQVCTTELTLLYRELDNLEDHRLLLEIQTRATNLAAPFAGDADIAALLDPIHHEVAQFQEAAHALSRDRVGDAFAICDRVLALRPGHTLFQKLRDQATERHRLLAEEYSERVERWLAAEPDFYGRRRILEKALAEYPSETRYAEELQSLEREEAVAESLEANARDLEKRGQIAEALAQWRQLQNIHPGFPGLEERIASCESLLDGQHRKVRSQRLLLYGQTHLTEGRFTEGYESLREAFDLSRDTPGLLSSAAPDLIAAARLVLPSNARQSDAMATLAQTLDEGLTIPQDLLDGIREARKKEDLAECWSTVHYRTEAGDLQGALAAADGFLANFPGEKQVESLRNQLLLKIERERTPQIPEQVIEQLAETASHATAVDPEDLPSLKETVVEAAGSDKTGEEIAQPASPPDAPISSATPAKQRLESSEIPLPEVHPRVDPEIERLKNARGKDKREALNRWVRQVDDATESGDYETASTMIRQAQQQQPERALKGLEQKLNEGLEKKKDSDAQLAEGERLFSLGNLLEGGDALYHAFELQPHDNARRTSIVAALLEQIRANINDDFEACEGLLAQAMRIRPDLALPADLNRTIAGKRHAAEAQRAATREMLEQLDRFAHQVEGARSKRSLSSVGKKMQDSGLLDARNIEVRRLATELLRNINLRLGGFQAPTNRDVREAALSRRRVSIGGMIAGILVVLAIAGVVFFLSRPHENGVPIQVSVTPDHAFIEIDGQPCVVPDCRLTLKPGEHVVNVRKSGYKTKSVAVAVRPGDSTPLKLNASLEPLLIPVSDISAANGLSSDLAKNGLQTAGADALALIDIRGALPLTRIRLDGEERGVVSNDGAFLLRVSPGPHTLDLSLDGFSARTIKRDFARGEIVSLVDGAVQLQPRAGPPPDRR